MTLPYLTGNPRSTKTISTQTVARDGALTLGKRVFDLLLCLTLLVPATLACMAAALLILAEDRANPFFVQRRVGRHGRPFKLYKLRTMRTGTGDHASHEAPAGMITRLGALLRLFKIDELPQILNVLSGDMSFVGPRPHLPSQELLTAKRREYGVDQLVPGITGISQVAGLDMSQPEILARSDAAYLGPWRLSKDLQLLAATATGSGRGDAANRSKA